MSIIAEAPGYLQVFSDGSVKRFAPEIVLASPEPSQERFKSKDVTIDPSKPITARIFLPDSISPQLPVMVYFHGGGFCIGSTRWLGYHHFLGDFSVASQSIVLSIDYRLAPENRLPVAYNDCYTSLQWLSHNVKNEPFLQRSDLFRVFLSGDSAGGNIVHQVAFLAMRDKTLQLRIKGLLPIHPYFGSEMRTEKEKADIADIASGNVASNDMFWRLSIPEGYSRDYYGCNIEMQKVSEAEWIELPPVVVFVAGRDFLKERGVMYAEFLRGKGVKRVEIVETEAESHVFHVFLPESKAAKLLQQQMTEFMKSC